MLEKLSQLKKCLEDCSCKVCSMLMKSVEFIKAHKKEVLIAICCLFLLKLFSC